MLLPVGQITGPGCKRNDGAQFGQGVRCLNIALPATRPPGAGGPRAQADIFGDAEIRRDGQFLVDHCHARAAGSDRIARAKWLTLDRDRPRIGADRAAEDLHQGAFASAIFTDQGVNFPSRDAQVDPR